MLHSDERANNMHPAPPKAALQAHWVGIQFWLGSQSPLQPTKLCLRRNCDSTTYRTNIIAASTTDEHLGFCLTVCDLSSTGSEGSWQVRSANLSRMWSPYWCMSKAGRASCSSSMGCILCRQLDTLAASSVCTSAAAAACPHLHNVSKPSVLGQS